MPTRMLPVTLRNLEPEVPGQQWSAAGRSPGRFPAACCASAPPTRARCRLDAARARPGERRVRAAGRTGRPATPHLRCRQVAVRRARSHARHPRAQAARCARFRGRRHPAQAAGLLRRGAGQPEAGRSAAGRRQARSRRQAARSITCPPRRWSPTWRCISSADASRRGVGHCARDRQRRSPTPRCRCRTAAARSTGRA